MLCDICGKEKEVYEIYGVEITGVKHICIECIIEKGWQDRSYFTHCQTCGKRGITVTEPGCTINEVLNTVYHGEVKCTICKDREYREQLEEEWRQEEIKEAEYRKGQKEKMLWIYKPLLSKLTEEEFDFDDPYPRRGQPL